MDPEPVVLEPAAAVEQILQAAQRLGSGWVLVASIPGSQQLGGSGAAPASCASQRACDFFLLSFLLFCCLLEPEFTMVG